MTQPLIVVLKKDTILQSCMNEKYTVVEAVNDVLDEKEQLIKM